MPKEFRLPDLGEGVHEGQIVRVLVAEGDHVREDQPLMEVETDKAAVEIPSPHSGQVTRVHIREEQLVHVGEVMFTFDEEHNGSASPDGEAQAPGPSSAVPATAPTTPGAAGGAKRHAASPAVRKLARSLGIDLSTVDGSGPGGRITRADVEKAAAGAAAGPVATDTPAPGAPTAPPPTPAPPAQLPGKPGEDSWGPVTTEPLTRIRKTIAETMARSASIIPHVIDTDDADVTELDKLRRGYVPSDDPGRKLTLLPFVVRAVSLALRRFPVFNASLDEQVEQITYKKYISICIGVQTDRGLVAPVLREADSKSIPQISDELHALTEKARAATFEVNDTKGGTFTVSNAGAMGGSRYSTPIINPPQVAVLALGRTRWQPWVVDGEVVPRYVLPLSLSFDHRLIDGGVSVPFMQDIIQSLQNPARLLL